MENQQKGSKAYLFSIVAVAVLGGLLFGYDTAVISGAEKGLQAFFLGAKDFVYTDVIHGLTSSSALIGCIIGSAISGYFAARLGRRPTLIISGVFFFLSALGSYYPEFFFFDYGKPTLSLLVAFNIYRIIGGVGVGLASAVNNWLNSLTAEEKILGGRVEMLESENSLTALMAGRVKFHIYITPPSPLQQMDWVVEYDISYLSAALAA